MDAFVPSPVGYTIFCKRDCGDCEKVKTLFESNSIQFTVISCDDVLVGDARPLFLDHVRALTQSAAPVRFPLVFHHGAYIGGLAKTRAHLDDEDW
jgi:glutaredoxin